MNTEFASTKVDGCVVNSHTVIFRGRYGVTIRGEDVEEMINLAMDHVTGEFGIISDRVYEFDIEPVSFYQQVNTVPSLKAIAIVSYRPTTSSVANIEQGLCQKPLAIFDSLESALCWMDAQFTPA